MKFAYLLLLILLFTLPAAGQEPDSDGDGVPDRLDYCWQEPGSAELFGCPPGRLPDLDGDGVPDPIDTCLDQPGLVDNFGCPAGIIPDLDRDGVPDARDACRSEFARTPDGCPPDTDGDGLTDEFDGCPDQPGAPDNLGCPPGVLPRDTDGDSVPDLFDYCPDQPGTPELNGCADRDGDGTSDDFDACPDQPGESIIYGCQPVTSTTLPAGLPVISPDNAAQVREVARLTLGLPRIALAEDGTLAVRASDNLLVYSLRDSLLTPRAEVVTGWSGYPVAATLDMLATYELPEDFTQLAYIQVRSRDGMPTSRVDAPQGGSLGITTMRFHPVVPLLAVGQAPLSGSLTADAPIRMIAVRDGRELAQFSAPGGAINIAFSGSGDRLAADYTVDGKVHIGIWNLSDGAEVAQIDTGASPHFLGTPMALNRDGSLLAFGAPDGTVSLYLIPAEGSPIPLMREVVVNPGVGEVVSAVAFSPDGRVIAAAGGVPFSAGVSAQTTFPIMLVDVGGARVIGQIGAHDSLPRDLLFSADGTLLLSAADNSVRFWGAR
jgi:hypothetical protein